ncbi:beta-N-acetylhexosaminidase [Flavivirga jejuensis]|uniref:beta-N-acetylhexosaminidase n=1 Tax=Flavivirga jejuensis TaxID=870487 RepID=A0ABT8WUW4_9FLAO|nr:beta-N-acetylhexosaminidase [Flavivirga jejuensis]MDO5976983.1 beta-N-acetylhexosaminidase [Flavivirga jejuensis]
MLTYKNTKKILIVSCIVCLLSIQASAQLNLIPHPNTIKIHGDTLELKKLKVSYDTGLKNEFETLQKLMSELHVKVVESKNANIELLIVENKLKNLGDEGYNLEINNKKIQIIAAKPAGIFYSLQTLLQLQTKTKNSKISFPCVSIQDKPAFKWRAFMLDESRHFKGKKVVFDMLDQMSKLKMNVFHWHLTDDQGWRIEIKKYPLLTEIGSLRNNTQINGVKSDKRTGKPHSGFYRQEDIKDIIDYAQKKHITIIPEIEMPGHASAAIASYPWLGTLDKPIEVPVTFGILPNIYNVANNSVYTFIEDVLQEVIDLFPSKIVHIGGDEVKFGQWKNNKEINDYMANNNLNTFSDIQILFTNKVSNFIESKGHRMMGWNDILGENLHQWRAGEEKQENNQKLAESAIVHFWKGSRELMLSAISKGHEVVNSQHNYTYLDYDFNSISLEKAYGFSPIPKDIDKSLENKILGLGCQMWGEWIPNIEDLYRQVFPRIAAYAEVGWTQNEYKNFTRFQKSLKTVKANWENSPYFTQGSKNPDYVNVVFNVDMNGSPYFKDIEGGREFLMISGTFTNSNSGAKEYWHSNGVTLTDYDYDGIYTGTRLLQKNSALQFILLKSPDGSWDNHIKILGDKSCKNITSENNYKIEIKEENLKVNFKVGQCLN